MATWLPRDASIAQDDRRPSRPGADRHAAGGTSRWSSSALLRHTDW